MSLIQAKCKTCGGALEVENSNESAVCPYCGAEYIIEKSVNNYNTYIVNGSVENINLYGNKAELKKRAQIFLESMEFKKSIEYCKKAINIDVEDGELYAMLLQARLKEKTFDGLLNNISRSEYVEYNADSTCYNAIKYLKGEKKEQLKKAVEINEKNVAERKQRAEEKKQKAYINKQKEQKISFIVEFAGGIIKLLLFMLLFMVVMGGLIAVFQLVTGG